MGVEGSRDVVGHGSGDEQRLKGGEDGGFSGRERELGGVGWGDSQKQV